MSIHTLIDYPIRPNIESVSQSNSDTKNKMKGDFRLISFCSAKQLSVSVKMRLNNISWGVSGFSHAISKRNRKQCL